jgi:cell division transport system permease protein
MAERSLRPRRSDDLGLRRALSDRLLPLVVASMVFLAALALAGAVEAAALARHFRSGAAATLTVEVPQAEADRAASALAAVPGAASRRVSADELAGLLKTWLGGDTAELAVALPAVFEVRLLQESGRGAVVAALGMAAPGAAVEQNGAWFDRLAALAGSLQACAALGLLVVTLTAGAVIAVATTAGLAARRDAIDIVHGLGATDGSIAGRFAGRISLLAFAGALPGLAAGLAMLLGLVALTAPLEAGSDAGTLFARLPPLLWELLPALPVGAAIIGWATAQITVRVWLGRLA